MPHRDPRASGRAAGRGVHHRSLERPRRCRRAAGVVAQNGRACLSRRRAAAGPRRLARDQARQPGIEEMTDALRLGVNIDHVATVRSEEHTSELQSLMRISYAVFCLKKKKTTNNT